MSTAGMCGECECECDVIWGLRLREGGYNEVYNTEYSWKGGGDEGWYEVMRV